MPDAVVTSDNILCKEVDVSAFPSPSRTGRNGAGQSSSFVDDGREGGIVSDGEEMQYSRRLWAIGDSCTFSNLPRITDHHLVQLKHEQVTYSSLSSASQRPLPVWFMQNTS
jgi:hypothetical protein